VFPLQTTWVWYNVKIMFWHIYNQIYIEYRHSSVAASDEFEKFKVLMHYIYCV
jgi:hypothetical protein